MIAIDSNLLVYAHRAEVRVHEAAARLVRALAEGSDAWAIPWPCCYEFLSIVTNPKIWGNDATPQPRAWRQIEAWTASPSNSLIGETEDFLPVLSAFVQRPRVHGAVVHDARLAAICVAHGVEALLTRDRDFALFPELRTRDPFT